MIRKDGYYWVKLSEDDSWVILNYFCGDWFDHYQEWVAHDEQVYQVHESEVLDPDESHNLHRDRHGNPPDYTSEFMADAIESAVKRITADIKAQQSQK